MREIDNNVHQLNDQIAETNVELQKNNQKLEQSDNEIQQTRVQIDVQILLLKEQFDHNQRQKLIQLYEQLNKQQEEHEEIQMYNLHMQQRQKDNY